ncbi:MAG: GNAT family N-acetyltransferase, partial [Acidimicrobiia bacterium]
MGIQIDEIDTPTAPESVLRELADYYGVIEAEDRPGDPPTPFAMMVADWRNLLPHLPVKRWALREDGVVVGSAVVVYDLEQNLQNGFGRINVHPDHRKRGYARMLARPMFDELEAAERTRFDTWVKQDDPAEDLCAKVGLKAVYGEKRSRLTIEDLDRELMAEWIERSA